MWRLRWLILGVALLVGGCEGIYEDGAGYGWGGGYGDYSWYDGGYYPWYGGSGLFWGGGPAVVEPYYGRPGFEGHHWHGGWHGGWRGGWHGPGHGPAHGGFHGGGFDGGGFHGGGGHFGGGHFGGGMGHMGGVR